MIILEQLLLSMETVRLAKIDALIREELFGRAEYAIKFRVPAPRKRLREVHPENQFPL
jgi:hypothetical protein